MATPPLIHIPDDYYIIEKKEFEKKEYKKIEKVQKVKKVEKVMVSLSSTFNNLPEYLSTFLGQSVDNVISIEIVNNGHINFMDDDSFIGMYGNNNFIYFAGKYASIDFASDDGRISGLADPKDEGDSVNLRHLNKELTKIREDFVLLKDKLYELELNVQNIRLLLKNKLNYAREI